MLILIMTMLIIFSVIIISYFFFLKPRLDPMNKAIAFGKQMRYSDAITEYKRVLYSEPNDINIHFKVADLYIKLNKFDQAIFHLNEIIRVGKYNYEVERLDVLKKLANAYYIVSDIEKSFRSYLDILSLFGEDTEAFYNIAFIALGQEEFDIAQRYFDRLIKLETNFEIFFGTGICCYQNDKIIDAIKYFKEAVTLKPESEIANLAVAFSLKKDLKINEAISYSNNLLNNVTNDEVKYILKRFISFLYIESDRLNDAISLFEEILELSRKEKRKDELMLSLYDLGFAFIKSNDKEKAATYWNELYSIDQDYSDIQVKLGILRNEFNVSDEDKDDFVVPIDDYLEDWLENAFASNFLWDICGLKSDKKIDIKNMLVTTKVVKEKEEIVSDKTEVEYNDRIDKFCSIDSENFRIISNRLVSKLGYKVDEILQTYRESDGVDFLAHSDEEKGSILIWVRRWKDTNVGEITLRNFAQAINDIKAQKGLFITTAELTSAAQTSLSKLSKVNVIYPDVVNSHLKGLIRL